MLTCFVDSAGKIHGSDPKKEYLRFDYDFERRRGYRVGEYEVLFPITPLYYELADNFFKNLVGTPDKLVEFVKARGLSKLTLAMLLDYRLVRPFYLDVCATVERLITKHCASKKDEHCLEGGCPFVEDGICTEACNREPSVYEKACVSTWLVLFECPGHRIDAWRK